MGLRTYLQQDYKGSSSFLDRIVSPIFGEDLDKDVNDEQILENHSDLQQLAKSTGITKITRIGHIDMDFNPIDIFDITVEAQVNMARNRIGIQHLVRRIMDTYSSAFMIFHYAQHETREWRFSFCHKGDGKETTNTGKRFTFLLGPGQHCRTAADNFTKLIGKSKIELKDIKEAFSVEALNDDFFKGYRDHYDKFVEHITGKRYVKKGDKWVEGQRGEANAEIMKQFENDEKRVRDYVKKLLGRIVFLHFLQKKGWLGVPADKAWGEGDHDFMYRLFNNAKDEQKEDFLDQILEPLFHNALNTDRSSSGDRFPEGSDLKMPYLNGGLFEQDEMDKLKVKFPKDLFAELLGFFHQYNFTIDENDPDDVQVGIDPEMLGRIFESLLEDNKDKGAFYTPKGVVQYMCRCSLIAYLQRDVADEESRTAIGNFVCSYDVTHLGGVGSDRAKTVFRKLCNVKICDPAIGSGAFPMGLLKELFFCRTAIEPATDPANIKREIIQNNIYGVDLERGAVDIARLRFWLSLVVDETDPQTLPNLDYKIMQGNSLLESYGAADLSSLLAPVTGEDLTLLMNSSKLEDRRKLLQEKLNDYYKEADHKNKKELQKEIHKLIQEQINLHSYNVKLPDLKEANEKFFLWHTWFSDVFNGGGFDIIIGNPPYVQLQRNGGKLSKLYKDQYEKTFDSKGDIYCLFYECGIRCLKPGGHLCLITSNKWMRSGYGNNTRKFLAENTNPKLLIDIRTQVFKSATVDVNILLCAKEKNEGKTICAKPGGEGLKNLSSFMQQPSNFSAVKFSGTDSWIVLSDIEQSIKEKIEKAGKPLKEWDVKIKRGVLTGCNDAFIIEKEIRDGILANCQTDDERKRTDALIRPILQGRDIKRYGYEWANKYLINTHNGVKGVLPRIQIEDYPAVKAHLDKYWDKIETRTDRGDTPYNLRNCAYMEDFSKPKIMWKIIGCNISFCFDEQKLICNNAVDIMTGEKDRLIQFVGIMNSKLFDWYLKLTTEAEVQGDGIQLYVSTLKNTLVKLDFPSSLTDIIYSRTRHESTDAEVDAAVYEAYRLSPEEQQFIRTNKLVNRIIEGN